MVHKKPILLSTPGLQGLTDSKILLLRDEKKLSSMKGYTSTFEDQHLDSATNQKLSMLFESTEHTLGRFIH